MKNKKGTIISIRGGVAEVMFKNNTPQMHSLFKSERVGTFFEVVEKSSFDKVKAIALSSIEGVERGEAVFMESEEISVSINKNILGRMFDLFGNPIDGKPFKDGIPVKLYGDNKIKIYDKYIDSNLCQNLLDAYPVFYE